MPVRLASVRLRARPDQSVEIEVISDDLGHVRTQTTENLYTSVLPELKQAAAAAAVAAVVATIHGTARPE
jgi:hypothetical protein